MTNSREGYASERRTVTITMPADVYDRMVARAHERGVSVVEVMERLVLDTLVESQK